MNLFGEICLFIERSLVFANNQAWQTQVLKFDDARELQPPFAAASPSVFIGGLVIECWNHQFKDGQWAMVKLLKFVGSQGGLNQQNEADLLIIRWRQEHDLPIPKPRIPNIPISRFPIRRFSLISGIILVTILISTLVFVLHPLGLGNTSTANNYSAIQPGPGCDSNGGTWTPNDINGISCGTSFSTTELNLRGYLYFQLPKNETFSSNNRISIIGTFPLVDDSRCTGLAEQGANTGYLAEYCIDGSWFIYEISNDGSIIKILRKNVTSTRSQGELALILRGTTISFSIDNEIYEVDGVSSIQPTKVAITFITKPYIESTTVNNFTYTAISG